MTFVWLQPFQRTMILMHQKLDVDTKRHCVAEVLKINNMYVCMHAYLYVCMHVYVDVHVYVYVYGHRYVHAYAFVHVHACVYVLVFVVCSSTHIA